MSTPQTNTSSMSDRSDEHPEGDGALRLDALGPAGLESLGEAPKKRFPVQLAMLAGLVIVAGGALFIMRKLGMGPVSAGATPAIKYEPVAGTSNDHEKILADLTSSHIEQQVPTEQVQRNPFRIADSLLSTKFTPVAAEKTAPGRDLEAEAEEQRRMARMEHQALINSARDSLQVHSILDGSRPVARINDKTVRIGDVVAEYFTVSAIHGRIVELTCEGRTIILSMDPEVEPVTINTPARSPSPAPAPKPASAPPR